MTRLPPQCKPFAKKIETFFDAQSYLSPARAVDESDIVSALTPQAYARRADELAKKAAINHAIENKHLALLGQKRAPRAPFSTLPIKRAANQNSPIPTEAIAQVDEPSNLNRHARRAIMVKGGVGKGNFTTYKLGPITAGVITTQKRIGAAEASETLLETVKQGVEDAIAWIAGGRNGEIKPLAIKGSAGLGKTRAVITHASPAIKAGKIKRVCYLNPTHVLSAEIEALAKDHGLETMVMRGRKQRDPESGLPMCQNHKNATACAGLGVNVYESLCENKEGARCPHFESCAYLKQSAEIKTFEGLVIGSHEYLTLPIAGLNNENLDMLIVDENHDKSLIHSDSMTIAEFTQPRTQGGSYSGRGRAGDDPKKFAERETEANIDFNRTLGMASGVLRTGNVDKTTGRETTPLTVADLKAAGLTEELCEFAATFEYSRMATADLTPDMAKEVQAEILESVAEDKKAFALARVWKVLATCLRTGQMTGFQRRLGYVDFKNKNAVPTDLFFYHFAKNPKINAIPTILLDGNLNIHALRRFWPACAENLHIIEPRLQNCQIIQVYDRAVSDQFLAKESTASAIWEMALTAAAEARLPADMTLNPKLRPYRGAVIVMKKTEDLWIKQGLIEAAGAEFTPLRNALPFEVYHQGAIRGIDSMKSCRFEIVVGRMQPSVEAIENQARAMFAETADNEDPLVFIEPDESGRRQWPMATRTYKLTDGSERTMNVPYHPDARIDSLLVATRESEIEQALSRARLIHRGADNPCKVYILTNIPLQSVEVDGLTTWNDLMPSRTQIALNRRVLPLIAADCLAAYPDLWPSYAAIRQDRSRFIRAQGIDGDDGDLTFNEIMSWELSARRDLVMIEYERAKAGGKKSNGRALCQIDPGEDHRAIIRRLKNALPDAQKIRIVGELPDPEIDQTALQAMIQETAEFIAWDCDLDDLGKLCAPQSALYLAPESDFRERPPLII